MKYGAVRKFYPIQLSDLGETNSSLDYLKNDARRKFKYSFGKFDRWFLSQFEIVQSLHDEVQIHRSYYSV